MVYANIFQREPYNIHIVNISVLEHKKDMQKLCPKQACYVI